MLDTFTTPWPMDLSSLDTMQFMVSQMTKEQSKMGGRAIVESVIPTDFDKADPPPYKIWSKEETSILITMYPTSSITEIMKALPNRSKNGIHGKVKFLKLSSKGRASLTMESKYWNRYGIGKEELYKLYWVDELSSKKIAKIYGCDPTTIISKMRKYGMKIRNNSDAQSTTYKNGRKVWNKGFTRETDERVDKYIEKMRKVILKQYRDGRKVWNTGTKGLSKSWNKGLTKETNESVRRTGEKNAINLKGRTPKSAFKLGTVPWNKGKNCPERSGENHPNWRGGRDPYYGPDWYSQNRLARERDRGICYVCHADEKDHPRRFDIHHIEPYRISQDNSLENIMTLCHSCHVKIENITADN